VELKLNTSCNLPKKMTTERPGKAGESGDEVLCTLAIKGVRVQRDQMDELCGWPIGCTSQLYDELGAPFQHTSFLLPKRMLLFVGTIEARKESGATTAELALKKAIVSSMRFSLDTPDDQGPTAVMSFTLQWKASGDEGDDVKHLLRDRCFLEGKFADEPQKPLDLTSNSPKAEKSAGHRAKLDRKRQAAGERESDDDVIPPVEAVTPPTPAPNPNAKNAKKKGGGLAQLEKEAAEVARKHPRREPPKKGAPAKKGRR
jgi:hypothetical protein